MYMYYIHVADGTCSIYVHVHVQVVCSIYKLLPVYVFIYSISISWLVV